MASTKQITVDVTGVTEHLPLGKLKAFQGDLKTLSEAALIKFKRQLIRNGFISPIAIWKKNKVNHILDGHQRLKALTALAADGYQIPDELPVVTVKATTLADAKRKLLALSSQYGDISIEGLDAFVDGQVNQLLSDARLMANEIDFTGIEELDIDEFFETAEKGTTTDPNPTMREVVCPHCGETFEVEV